MKKDDIHEEGQWRFYILLQYRSLYHPYMPVAFKLIRFGINSSGYYEMLNMLSVGEISQWWSNSRLLSNNIVI